MRVQAPTASLSVFPRLPLHLMLLPPFDLRTGCTQEDYLVVHVFKGRARA